MGEHLPIFDDIVAKPFVLRDFRSVDEAMSSYCRSLQAEAIRRLCPPEIMCECRATDRLDAAQSGSSEAELSERRALNAHRHSFAFYLGEFDPVNFVVISGDEIVGAFQWYAIERAGERYRAGWLPSHVSFDAESTVRMAIALVEHFLTAPVQLADGSTFDLSIATAPLFDDGSERTRIIREVIATVASSSRIEFENNPDDDQDGRSHLEVRRARSR